MPDFSQLYLSALGLNRSFTELQRVSAQREEIFARAMNLVDQAMATAKEAIRQRELLAAALRRIEQQAGHEWARTTARNALAEIERAW